MNETLFVAELDRAKSQELENLLRERSFELRPAQHAHFQARGEEVNVTCYISGKLVVQGRGTRKFIATYLGMEPTTIDVEVIEEPTIGTDESGKGDYFGPLVVAACFVTPSDAKFIDEWGLRDSKKVSDRKILAADSLIRARLPHAVVSLMPAEYNAEYSRVGNLNRLLGNLHARVIAELLDRVTAKRVVSDKFGDEKYIREALGSLVNRIDIVQRVRAESHPAVAAASFLARAGFLDGLAALREEAVCDLPLGASSTVEAAAREIIALQGLTALPRFAKMHFRITERLSTQ